MTLLVRQAGWSAARARTPGSGDRGVGCAGPARTRTRPDQGRAFKGPAMEDADVAGDNRPGAPAATGPRTRGLTASMPRRVLLAASVVTNPLRRGPIRGDPVHDAPSGVAAGDDEHGDRKHDVGHIEFAYGLLITPTWDIRSGHRWPGSPYRVLVPSWGSSGLQAHGTTEDKQGLSGVATPRMPICTSRPDRAGRGGVVRDDRATGDAVRRVPPHPAPPDRATPPPSPTALEGQARSYWARGRVNPRPCRSMSAMSPTRATHPGPRPYDTATTATPDASRRRSGIPAESSGLT